MTADVDVALVRTGSMQRYLAEEWIPIRRTIDGTIVIATSRIEHAESLRARLEDLYGVPVSFYSVTGWEIRTVLIRVFAKEVAGTASDGLWSRNPEMSAKTVFSRGQVIGFCLLVVIVVLGLIFVPATTIAATLALASLVFLAGTAFKFVIAMRGARFDVVERISDAEVSALRDEDLPTYTVLVPVFRESNIVAQLVENLGGLDYPRHKLEVLILIEEEDHETRVALLDADPPEYFHIVTIPVGHPQTKPRACNVGLAFASGEFLVIYDAEDTPDPDQLKKAIVAFERGGRRMVCVQAALNYFNASENALTRMFTLEYSYWFDYMLSGLDASDLPIPLGGTSNHFRTSALEQMGGWDPYNVTEDADLGIRASALGYRVGVIDSTTMEEANTSVPNFVRQRSRWIKGYMQTVLVHARRPGALLHAIGARRFLAFALLIAGTPLTFLAVLPFYALTAFSLFAPVDLIALIFPVWVLWLCLFNFLIGNGLIIYLSMMGPYKRGAFSLIGWSLLNPVYWILHSVAAYKGLWQLVTKPHYWEKTEHGLTAQHGNTANGS